jgi:AcrR family transcriptional regulator
VTGQSGSPARRPPGRPRDDLDGRIRAATLALLARDGFQRLAMTAVATEAGIGKPTLYRRFDTKARLVAWALTSMTAPASSVRLPDDPREALAALLVSTAGALATPGSLTILGSLLAQAATDPELIETFRDVVFHPQHTVVHATIRSGIDRGDLRPGLDTEAVDAMLFGALLARAILGDVPDEEWALRVVDAAWPALTARPPGPARPRPSRPGNTGR